MATKIPSMQDMRLTPQEGAAEMSSPSPPAYPYGLCVSLCNDELEKLGLADEDLAPGDFIHLHSLAKVTSVSKNDTVDDSHCRVELVLAFMSAEDEEDENSDEEKDEPITKRLYK